MIISISHFPPNLALIITLSGSNYPCLEQIIMVPEMFDMFQPLKSNSNFLLMEINYMNILNIW